MEIYNMQEESLADMSEFDIYLDERLFDMCGTHIEIEYNNDDFDINVEVTEDI